MAETRNPNDLQKFIETSFQDHLLTYVVYLTKEKFKPNKDENTNFYYGVVTNIVQEDTKNYDKRDIFYSRIDGQERINATTTKYQTKKTIYFVHIPALHSILFSNESYTKDSKEITPEDLYKFRVEQLGKDVEAVQIGNVVKVSFENVGNFTGGIIEQRVDDKLFELKLDPKPKELPKQVHEDIEACKKSPLAMSEGQGRVLFNSVLSTKDVISMGLFDFLEFFTTPNGFASQTESSLKVTAKYTIETSEQTLTAVSNFGEQNPDFSKVQLGVTDFVKYYITKNDALTKPNIINIKIRENGNPINLINNFIVLFSSYAIQAKKIDNTTMQVTFDIDAINEKDFLAYSQQRYVTLKEFDISPTSIQFTGEQVSNIKSADANPNNTACDNILNPGLYIDISKDNWKRKSKDQKYIDYFFNGKSLDQKDSFSKVNILSSLNVITAGISKDQKEKAVKFNGNFYTLTGTEEINSLEGKTGKISFEKVEDNLNFVKKDLEKLRAVIKKNENILDQNILMLPISWFETKPRTTTGQDSDNQHWYGRAVDFVVYIKQEQKIYQIPPEIIALYIEKFLKTLHGIGLFTSSGSYTHYERLESLKVTKDKVVEERYWAEQEPADELEKTLSKVSPQDFIFTLKEYLQKNYSFKQIGLPAKLGNLL